MLNRIFRIVLKTKGFTSFCLFDKKGRGNRRNIAVKRENTNTHLIIRSFDYNRNMMGIEKKWWKQPIVQENN